MRPPPYRGRTGTEYYAELLRPIFAGRPVIVTGGPVAGLVGLARSARELGAARVFVLGSEGRGTGPAPEPDEAEWLALAVSAPSMVEGVRAGQGLLANLPRYARAAIDRFDPAGEALVLPTFLVELPEVAGRPCLGHRRPEWVALEDKVGIDDVWIRASVDRAPSEVVPVQRTPVLQAARTLDSGLGTVWAADARDGYHGGAEGLRWVRTDDDIEPALAFLAARSDRVRVMPFLEGIPCSIHGVVFDDHVAALRPLEIVTLRPRVGSSLFYAGVASFWDPAADDREAMREAARRVGAVLRELVGFRGEFTVDGVMTADGFRPTELNPRAGAGLQTLASGLETLHLPVLNAAISAGLALDFRPAELERLVVDGADTTRGGGTWRAVPASLPETSRQPLRSGPDGYAWASGAQAPDGWVTAGPSMVGGFARFVLNAERTPVGPSVADRAVAFWRFADTSLGTGVGELEPARAAR